MTDPRDSSGSDSGSDSNGGIDITEGLNRCDRDEREDLGLPPREPDGRRRKKRRVDGQEGADQSSGAERRRMQKWFEDTPFDVLLDYDNQKTLEFTEGVDGARIQRQHIKLKNRLTLFLDRLVPGRQGDLYLGFVTEVKKAAKKSNNQWFISDVVFNGAGTVESVSVFCVLKKIRDKLYLFSEKSYVDKFMEVMSDKMGKYRKALDTWYSAFGDRRYVRYEQFLYVQQKNKQLGPSWDLPDELKPLVLHNNVVERSVWCTVYALCVVNGRLDPEKIPNVRAAFNNWNATECNLLMSEDGRAPMDDFAPQDFKPQAQESLDDFLS